MLTLPELPQSPEFKEAAAAVSSFAKMPDKDDALELYGLYKFGRHGKNPESAPWGSKLPAGLKWDAWNKVSESGITPDEAQKQYIEVHKRIAPKYQA